MISKRTFLVAVGLPGFVALVGLVALIVMELLFHDGAMDYEFVALLVSLMGVLGVAVSWIYSNFVHHLTDEHRDKLEKIVGKILQVHQTVKSIAYGNYSREEFVRVRKEYKAEYAKHADYYEGHGNTGMYDEEGLMFSHQFEQSKDLFSELRGLRNSARLYFEKDLLNIMEDLHEVIESLRRDIGRINIIAGEIGGQSLEDKRKIRELKESIWSLAWGEVWGNDEDGATQKRLEKFMSIPDRIDKVLSKYALKR